MEEAEVVVEEEMQQVAAISQDGETFYVQLPKSIHIGPNHMVTSEVDEDGQQVLRIVEITPNDEDEEQEVEESMDVEGQEEVVVHGDIPTSAADALSTSSIAPAALPTESDGLVTINLASQEADNSQLVVTAGDESQQVVTVTNNTQVMSDGTQLALTTDDTQQVVTDNTQHVVTCDGTNVMTVDDNDQPVVKVNEDSQQIAKVGDDAQPVVTVNNDTQPVVTVPGTYEGEPLTESGGQDLEIFQQAMTLLQEKSSNPATTVVSEDAAQPETVYILQDPISMETPEGSQVMVLAPAVGGAESGREQQAGVDDIINPKHKDTLNIIKKRRGRPKKTQMRAHTAKTEVPKKTEEVSVQEEGIETGNSGRPRRKAAQRFLEIWRAMNKKADMDIEESTSPPPSPLSMSRPSQARGNKENMAPRQPSIPASKDPTTVNITIRDKTALKVLDDVGIHMMYYCRRCTFFSKQLHVLSDHILECRKRELTAAQKRRADDAFVTNAILSNAALKGIAECDLEAIKNAGDRCIAIDEHNYADVVEEEVGEEAGELERRDPEEEVEEEEEELPEELRPRKWFCLDCPDVIYGEKDLEIHRKCHGKSGLDPLHCYECALEKGHLPKSKCEWKQIRSHLRHYHKVDFEIVCVYCGETLKDHAEYRHHVTSHSLECEHKDCGFITDNFETLSVHQNSHVADSATYSCCMCQEPCPDWLTLRQHLVQTHPGIVPLLYSCMECDEAFQQQKAFQDHILSNTSTGKLACHLCDKTFYLCALPAHLRTEHSDAEGEEAAQVIENVANQCPTTCQSEKAQDGEEGQTEGGGQNSQVNIELSEGGETGRRIEKKVVLMQEVEDVSSEAEKQQEEGISAQLTTDPPVSSDLTTAGTKKYRCPHHGLVFHSQADLTKHHMEVHWGVTKERVTQIEEQRKRDRETKMVATAAPARGGPGRPRKTKNLGEDDSRDPEFKVSGFSSHRKNQSGGAKSVKCKHCYKKFNNGESLMRHMTRSHTPDRLKPMECRSCGKFFKNGIQLRNHVRVVHEGVKRIQSDKKKTPVKKKTYMCETCGYTTPELNRLTNHKMSVHEGCYPYHCTLCDYKTNERADMKRHNHKHRGIKRYNCTYCSYKSDQRWLLVNHCSRQHSIHLNRLTRNTKGATHGSNRKKGRRDDMDPAITDTIVIQPDTTSTTPFAQEIVVGGERYLVPMVTTNEHGEESVSMVAMAGEGTDLASGEVSVETVEEDSRPGEVVYIQEDGTVIDPEEAAIMLVAVAPDGTPAVTETVVHAYT